MSAEGIRKERSVVRRIFSRYANELATVLDKENIQVDSEITALFLRQKEQSSNLQELDTKFKELVLDTISEEDLEKEIEDELKYKTKWFQIEAKYAEVVARNEKPKKEVESEQRMEMAKKTFRTDSASVDLNAMTRFVVHGAIRNKGSDGSKIEIGARG
ncbi:hypothetical protein ACJJTC_004991 [Scirpophaga incertulas]